MAETINPNPEIQPLLFSPDGSLSPEVKKALKELEIEQNREYSERLNKEIQELTEERRQNHAP